MPTPSARGLPRRHSPPPSSPPVRSTHLIGGLALGVAVWFGVTAPSTSPVATVPAQVTTSTAATATQVADADLERVQVRGRDGDRGRSEDGR